MFSVDSFIESVQIQKKWFVNAYFTDVEVRDSLCDFVDKQTAFVKQVIKTNDIVFKYALHLGYSKLKK